MQNPANVITLNREKESHVSKARVISCSGKDAVISVSGMERDAKIAFSCLVRPLPGDTVLCSADEEGIHHVLAILDRPEKQHMTLSFPADASLVAENGELCMASNNSLTLASGDSLNCYSKRAIHKSAEATVDFHELTARGDSIQASYRSVFFVSRVINTMAKQVIAKAKSYIRRTEDYDQVNAKNMTRKAEATYSVDSKRTVMVSRKDTKIDAERIFMG